MLTDKLMSILDNIQNSLCNISQSNLVYASGVNNFRCTSSCANDCSGDCSGNCDASCSGLCTDSCAGDCQSLCGWECSSSEY